MRRVLRVYQDEEVQTRSLDTSIRSSSAISNPGVIFLLFLLGVDGTIMLAGVDEREEAERSSSVRIRLSTNCLHKDSMQLKEKQKASQTNIT